jgi:hypothetical protein
MNQEHLNEIKKDLFQLNQKSWVRIQLWECNNVKFSWRRVLSPYAVLPTREISLYSNAHIYPIHKKKFYGIELG